MSGSRVVIVGGGVIGVATAHWLSKAGASVTVIDKGTIGGGCSHGNCGYVCPSHILPLAMPGAIRSTLRTFFQRDAALKIRPRFDPLLWLWLLRFARRCNRTDMLASAEGIAALLKSSRELYGELFRSEPLEAEWEERGLLFVFRTEPALHHYDQLDALLRERFGMASTRYDGVRLNELEPALKPGLAGGRHYPLDAHLRPDKLMASWRRLLTQRGVEFREQCGFRGLQKSGGSVTGIETEQGAVPASAIVFATGAWTPLLQDHLGVRVPIQPGKGYSITMPMPRIAPKLPMIFEEHHVAVTPFGSGYRIGSTMEFAGYEERMNRSRLAILTNGAAHYLREPTAEPVQEEWWGWRPMIFDGKPIIDRAPSARNVWIAAGHGMLGLSMATGTGRLVSELLTATPPHIDPHPYRLSRF